MPLLVKLRRPFTYRSAGAFIVPPEARWENIRKAAQAVDIKVKLDKVLELLERKYPDRVGLLEQRRISTSTCQTLMRLALTFSSLISKSGALL
jgi:hypothetical protein